MGGASKRREHGLAVSLLLERDRVGGDSARSNPLSTRALRQGTASGGQLIGELDEARLSLRSRAL